MKVRLSPSMIRIRVNMYDVAQWLQEGKLELCMPWKLHQWKIELSFSPNSKWRTPDRGANLWSIQVPLPAFKEWINSNQESIGLVMDKITVISIEKDYPCEHRLEKETRNFTRPHETH